MSELPDGRGARASQPPAFGTVPSAGGYTGAPSSPSMPDQSAAPLPYGVLRGPAGTDPAGGAPGGRAPSPRRGALGIALAAAIVTVTFLIAVVVMTIAVVNTDDESAGTVLCAGIVTGGVGFLLGLGLSATALVLGAQRHHVPSVVLACVGATVTGGIAVLMVVMLVIGYDTVMRVQVPGTGADAQAPSGGDAGFSDGELSDVDAIAWNNGADAGTAAPSIDLGSLPAGYSASSSSARSVILRSADTDCTVSVEVTASSAASAADEDEAASIAALGDGFGAGDALYDVGLSWMSADGRAAQLLLVMGQRADDSAVEMTAARALGSADALVTLHSLCPAGSSDAAYDAYVDVTDAIVLRQG